ncbi:MAG: circadian phase modifier CpmA, partial [Cyanobium sp. MAG_237]|nr:circadian phase modifier CpmA [Cyanobium sp. MAG_237]
MSGTPEHRLDLGRRQRLGMVEAIWGEHKSAEQLARILEKLHGAGELALVTRISPEKAKAVAAILGPELGEAWLLQHHPQA